jgi:hypothetical protein
MAADFHELCVVLPQADFDLAKIISLALSPAFPDEYWIVDSELAARLTPVGPDYSLT